MKRTWGVRPDETGTISREALIGALVDGATMLDIAGGCLQVVVGRAPTDMPGEMVMTGAAITWQDRTDATASPERPASVTPEQAPVVEQPEPETKVAAVSGAIATAPLVEPTEDNPDGFDYDKLADEDIEDQPVAAR